jgi:hypothetical protein
MGVWSWNGTVSLHHLASSGVCVRARVCVCAEDVLYAYVWKKKEGGNPGSTDKEFCRSAAEAGEGGHSCCCYGSHSGPLSV